MFARAIPRAGHGTPFLENSPIRGQVAPQLIAKRIVDILWAFEFPNQLGYGSLVGILKREFPDMGLNRATVHQIIITKILSTPDRSALFNLDGDGFRTTEAKTSKEPLTETILSVPTDVKSPKKRHRSEPGSVKKIAARMVELLTANPSLYLEDVAIILKPEFPNNLLDVMNLRIAFSNYARAEHPEIVLHQRPKPRESK